ncbi:MAG: 6-carboxytetrahydropterin synthase QueD [Clostridiaceae bacterium]|nr:6-carboxytetrahydropterin synthase QueD [Clostridiaceae bacterium]
MYQITVEQSFDSAHFLSDYQGKCSNLHGHRWRVIFDIQGETLRTDSQLRGMCEDFSDVRKVVRDMLDEYDHTLLVEQGSLKEKTLQAMDEEGFAILQLPFRPTAENFARHFYDLISEKGYQVAKVSVYETPNNCASYYVS